MSSSCTQETEFGISDKNAFLVGDLDNRFDDTALGSSENLTLDLKNLTPHSMEILAVDVISDLSSIGVTNPFFEQVSAGPFDVTATLQNCNGSEVHDSCEVEMTFSPTTPGMHRGYVRIQYRTLSGKIKNFVTRVRGLAVNPLSTFSITGITGGAGDVTSDQFLLDGPFPTLNWTDATAEVSYEVTILESDGSTIACPTASVPADTLNYNFSTCSLVEGRAYQATVTAKAPSSGFDTFALNNNFDFLYAATISIASNSGTEDSPGNITATLSAASDWPVSFEWSTTDGTALSAGPFQDFNAVPSTPVTIPSGITTSVLSTTLLDDPRDEPDQDFTITINLITNARVGTNVATFKIIDNDAAPVVSLAGNLVQEGDTANLSFVLSEVSEYTVTFNYSRVDGTATVANGDFVGGGGTASFLPGATTHNFSVITLEDIDVCEFQENMSVSVSGISNATVGAIGDVDIQDNDFPTIIVSDTAPVVEGNDLVFGVTLSQICPAFTVSFDFQTVDVTTTVGLDYISQSGSISFPPGNTVDSITISTIDDSIRDLDEEFLAIGIRNKSFADNSTPSIAKGRIDDNEVGIQTVKIATAGGRTCALSSDGRIKCWGLNLYLGYDGGHYGDEVGEMGDSLLPIDLGTHDGLGITPHTAKQTINLLQYNCVILDDDRVKCWGEPQFIGLEGSSGPRGDDVNELGDNLEYVNLGTHDGLGIVPHTVKSISASRAGTTCAHLDDDRVKCWGQNSRGEVGIGVTGGFQSVIGDQVNEMGDNLPYVDFGTHDGLGVTPHTAKQVSHPCAILDDDRVKCWGRGDNGLGYGNTDNIGDDPNEMGDFLPYVDLGTGRSAKKIAAECVILDNDQVKCWGYNQFFGVLGQGDQNSRGDDPGEMGDALFPVDLGTHDGLGLIPHTAKDISRGNQHICVILDDDRLKCWGRNDDGQLGHEDTNHLGDFPGEMGDSLPYSDLGPGRTAQKVWAFEQMTFVLRDDNTLVSFGQNEYGTLGLGDALNRGDDPGEMGAGLTPVDLGTGLTAIDMGEFHASRDKACAVLSNGSLKCWGAPNFRGSGGRVPERMYIGDQLAEMGAGLQTIQLPPGRTATNLFGSYRLAVEYGGFCATLDDGTFVCWGIIDMVFNNGGQNVFSGNRPNTMGSFLDQHTLPGGARVLTMYPHYREMCALSEDLDLICWGTSTGNLNGKFLQGNTTNPGLDPTNGVTALVGTGRKVLQASFGNNHACAVLDDFSAKCWGRNNRGQLGLGDTLERGTTPATTGDNLLPVDLGTTSYPVQMVAANESSCALFANGGVKCWGDNAQGELGYENTTPIGMNPGEMGNSLSFVNINGSGKKIYADYNSSGNICLIRADNSIVCWGDGSSGKLGHGSTLNHGGAPGNMGAGLVPVDLNGDQPAELSITGRNSCALLTNSNVKCWGQGKYGQLGNGSTEDRGDAPGELGALLPPIPIVW